MFDDLMGKTALVTGGGGAIGGAVSRGLGRAGASVVVADVDEEAAARTVERMADEGSTGIAAALDVTDERSVTDVFASLADRWSTLHIVVNNAGVGRPGSLQSLMAADLDLMVAVNVLGSLRVLRHAASVMRSQGSGSIVNMASTSAFVASFNPNVAYDMTKGAVRQMTVSAAAELAPVGVRVNAVAPGTIDAGLSLQSPMTPDRRAMFERNIPMGRLGTPDDLVGAVLYLASDLSTYVCGHVLVVDGGRLLH